MSALGWAEFAAALGKVALCVCVLKVALHMLHCAASIHGAAVTLAVMAIGGIESGHGAIATVGGGPGRTCADSSSGGSGSQECRQRRVPTIPQDVWLLLPLLVSCRTSQRRQSNVRVLGLQRPLFAALLVAAALYCMWRSGGWLRLLLALAAGACNPSMGL